MLRFKAKLICLFFLLLSVSCKKAATINLQKEVSPTTGTRAEFTIDSIFLYAKQIYLWNDALPAYNVFNPRTRYGSITPEVTAFQKEIFDISQLKINPETGQPFEASKYNNSPKFSFLQIGKTVGGASQAGMPSDNPILTHEIILSNNKTIAYIAISSFPSLDASKGKFDRIFEELAIESPTFLIVDLRSNSGGYIETAQYIANLIAPRILNGKMMYAEQFNSTMQTGNGTILSHQPYLDKEGKTVTYKGRIATMADVDYSEGRNTYFFDKIGKFETVQKIYFIVSGQTASASELLISCFKPYFDVKLIGEPTYGKPVGFFAINLDQYTVYLSSFLIKNASGWAGYFLGMAPDIPIVSSINPKLGDIEEPCLSAALSVINSNQKSDVVNGVSIIKKFSNASPSHQNVQFKIDYMAIENRLRLRD